MTLIKVVSYNVLAQRLINREMFSHVPRKSTCLKSKNRRSKLAQEIIGLDSDILCFQEADFYLSKDEPTSASSNGNFDGGNGGVEKSVVHLGRELEALGYDSAFISKPKMGTNSEDDGCATFWKREKFKCIGYDWVDFSKCFSHFSFINSVGLSVALVPITDGSPASTGLIVNNCHLYWRKNAEFIRIRQLEHWLKRAEIFRSNILSQSQKKETTGDDDLTVLHKMKMIFCGDLNSMPEDPWYRILGLDNRYCDDPRLLTGIENDEIYRVEEALLKQLPVWKSTYVGPGCFVNAKKIDNNHAELDNSTEAPVKPSSPEELIDKLQNETTECIQGLISSSSSATNPYPRLQSAYATMLGSEPEYTTYRGNFQGTLDYIFFERDQFECRKVKPIPPLHESKHYIPSEQYPSDHVSLLASLELK